MSGMTGGQSKSGTLDAAKYLVGGAQAPFLRAGLEGAQQEFLGQDNPYLQQYQQMLAERGAAGAPYEAAGAEELGKTLRGDYLYGGPGFEAAMGAAQRSIQPKIESMFAKYGRSGSPAEQQVMTQQLSDAFAGLYGQERERMSRAVGQIPGMQSAQYADIGAVGEAGDMRRKAIERYLQAVGGIRLPPDPQKKSILDYYLRSTGGTLSGMGTGAMAGAQFGPQGAMIGAGLGGLAGGLGGLLEEYQQ